MTYRHMLLAVDLGEGEDEIGERAAALAKALGATLHLLHVVDYAPMDPSGEAMMPPPTDVQTQLLDTASDRLAAFARQIGFADAPRDVGIGNIKSEIVRAAEEMSADLIVIGRHQRHGLALLLGSRERSLMSAAPCDVLAVQVEEPGE
jgi:universal stress protein A